MGKTGTKPVAVESQTPAELVTVDTACEKLGLTRKEITDLIAGSKLSWDMSADKTTVMVVMPPDKDKFLREFRGELPSMTVMQAAAKLGVTRGTVDLWIKKEKLVLANTGRPQRVTSESVEELKQRIAKIPHPIDAPIVREPRPVRRNEDLWYQKR